MPDNMINIGAIVSTDGVQEGIATTAEAIKAGVNGMTVSFQEMSTKAQAAAAAANRAFTSISADTKAAAAGLTEQALKEATLAKARMAANFEVRTSAKLLNNEYFDGVKAVEVYAAATQKLIAIDAEIAAAQKEAASAAAKAAEEMNLSSNVIIASFQRIALSAKESFGEVQEMMAGTMERANITASGVRFSLSGLSELMGIGLVVGGFAEAADSTVDFVAELGHLSVETGINVKSLSGLQKILRSMHVEAEPAERGLVRLARAMVLGKEAVIKGSGATDIYVRAFHDLGISMDEVGDKTPEQVLYRVSAALKGNVSVATAANSALTLFGKGGAALIPVLEAQGVNLEKNMKLQGETTGVTDESVEAALRWTAATTNLETAFRRGMIPVFEETMPLLHGIAAGFLELGAATQAILETIAGAVLLAGEELGVLGKTLADASKGNYGALIDDAKLAKSRFVDVWKSAANDIKSAFKAADAFAHEKPPAGLKEGGVLGGSDHSDDPFDKKVGKDHASRDLMHTMEEEFSKLQQSHRVTLKEEHDFWAERITQFKHKTDEYRQISAKLGTIDQSGAKQASAIIAKFKAQSAKGGADERGADSGESEFQKSVRKMAEDITRTGESWKEYWSAVARGSEIEASMQASLEETRIRIQESTGGITELGAAHAMARIHTEEHTRALKALQDELAALEKQAAASPKDSTTGALLNGQLAGQIQGVKNQISQQKGQGANQGMQDTAAINAAMVKPYVAAFNQIDAGWKKVQTDLINGNRNIARDFAQMGVNLVQGLASHFEEIIAKHALMWVRMEVAHLTATQAGVAIDAEGAAQSDSISMISALKQVSQKAASAAAGAWSAMSSIPIIGPELGAIAAAATYAGVMALAAFEQGGVVGGSPGMAVPILAHSGERVLSNSQTNNFERLINNDNNGGGSNTLHANVTQNFGSSGNASSAKETRASIQSLMRRGKLSYS